LKKLCLILFSLFCVSLIVAQDLVPPTLNCVNVVDGDDVDVHWTKPDVMPANFSHYEIRFSITNINFVQFETVAGFDTELFNYDVGVADNQPVYFFMRSVDSNGLVSENSDTLSTIFLNLNGQNFIAPLAEMLWNPIFSAAQLEVAEGTYSIQRNFGSGWIPAGTKEVGEEFFSELNNICHGDDDSVMVSYRVQLPNPAGCVSTSDVKSGRYQDVNPPSLPDLETVTVDTASNNASICWYPSPEGDTQGYIIQEVDIDGLDTNYFTIGQTNLPNELSFEHLGSDAAQMTEYFVVIPYDSCIHSGNTIGNTNGNINSSFLAQTIFVENELNRCERAVTLNWNRYIHWDEGVFGYEILGSENGGPYQLVGTRGPNASTFTISNLEIDSNYCFFIKAISNGIQKDSHSNVTCVTIEYPERPDFAYLSNVSVLGDREISLTAYHSGGTSMKYFFEKYDPNFNDFFGIGTVVYDPLMGQDVEMIDFLNAPVNQSNRYRVSLIDSCGENYISSQESRNVLLNVVANSNNGTNNLVWNKYGVWEGNVEGYNIYRQKRGETPTNLIASVPQWRTDYIDDVNAFIDVQGEFCYFIEAIENPNSFGFAKNSISNSDCGTQKPIFWIPNAIVFGGVNQEFKPVGGFLNIENYSLIIFNRWGQEIFLSEDFDTGWRGIFKGSPVPQGVYFYYIRYQGGDGTVFEQRGDVYFINDSK